MRRTRARLAILLLFALSAGGWAIGAARAESTLRIGMTAADIPQTTGIPDQGGEGYRFIGYQLYDALVNWDLSRSDVVANLTPGLATEWHPDPADPKKWIFKLRQGVEFHDGSPFNADAVIWNLDKILKEDAPQYDPRQVAQVMSRIPSFASYRKIDDFTVEITTKFANSLLPYETTGVLFSSPAQFEAVGRNWAAFAAHPSGTGPFKLERLVPRERAELVRNADYWDPKRVPKLDRVILLPIPEATQRTAALLSGRIDWNEAPAPDTLPALKAAGMQVILNPYPHNWTYQPSLAEGGPFTDIRVRQAVNLAIDRDGLVKLLNGTAQPGLGLVYPDHPWYGTPTFKVRYDPAEAKRLLAETGYGPDKPLKLKIAISTSGSGQMQPLMMNEFVQQNLKDVGVDAEFEVVEWMSLLVVSRSPANSPENRARGIDAINVSRGFSDPYAAFQRMADSRFTPPRGANWGMIKDPVIDGLDDQVLTTFDEEKRDDYLRQINARIVDQAWMVFICHDLNPRALSPKVKGFVQAQSWYQDLTPIEMR
jgi:ABC-type transport system substrate-binding protein